MIELTLAQVAGAVGGTVVHAGPATAVPGPVVIDSRQAVPGALFVALPGERADGHDFAAAAVRGGAVAMLGTRDVGVPAVLVDDARLGLGRLARHALALTSTTVVGLTGSSGKTSTKDLLAVLLAELGPTVAPANSFNNELGVPLTALRCDRDTRFLVCEMGARAPGNIRYLCEVAPPRIALVLNVGQAHLGEFGSLEVTAATKGELVEALPDDGIAVLNVDDPLVRAMASRTRARVVWFGRGEAAVCEAAVCEGAVSAAAVAAVDVRLDGQARARFTLVTPHAQVPVALRLHGEHHVANALAAAAVALEAGLAAPRVAELLSAATPTSRWRMEVSERPDGVTVVNDAYNANPDSVRAALAALDTMGRADPDGDPGAGPGAGPGDDQGDGRAGNPANRGRRTWAVLGEMLELGERSTPEHEAIGRLVVRLGISRLVAVGEGARPYRQGALDQTAAGAASTAAPASTQADWVPDVDAALVLLHERVRPGDVVLVKASRGIGLDRLAASLLADAGPLGQDVGRAVDGSTSRGAEFAGEVPR